MTSNVIAGNVVSDEFKALVDTLKEKIFDNITYFIATENFSKDGFFIYKRATLIPSLMGADSDNVVLTIIYKVLPNNLSVVEAGEGILNISYVDLASLLIARKVIARYTEQNKTDNEIEELINTLQF